MDFELYSLSKKGIFSTTYFIHKEIDPVLYTVKKKSMFSSTYLFIDDMENLVLSVARAPGIFKMGFEIFDGEGRKLTHVYKEGMKNNLRAEYSEDDIFIKGNFGRSNYTFTHLDREIGKVSRKRHGKHKIGVALASNYDQLVLLGMVVAIEMKIQYQNAAAAASG